MCEQWWNNQIQNQVVPSFITKNDVVILLYNSFVDLFIWFFCILVSILLFISFIMVIIFIYFRFDNELFIINNCNDIDNKWPTKHKMLTRARTVFLTLTIVCAYVVWGALWSLQAPFYPLEAAKKGATPSQVYHKRSKVCPDNFMSKMFH